ncbi:MAG: response regulator [Bacteroidetes bacterium]|nr:response regulator [Bacteroidota bacterium]MBS1686432.1 response regulator [Bacteroidota bacterium]
MGDIAEISERQAKVKLCALIVDDDHEDHQIIREAFTMFSSVTGTFHYVDNGQRAIDFLTAYQDASELPSLIVLDINMPLLNGLETLKILKEHEMFKMIPVVIFSSSYNPSDIEMARQHGAADYITKPNSFSQYKEIIDKLSVYCCEAPAAGI